MNAMTSTAISPSSTTPKGASTSMNSRFRCAGAVMAVQLTAMKVTMMAPRMSKNRERKDMVG